MCGGSWVGHFVLDGPCSWDACSGCSHSEAVEGDETYEAMFYVYTYVSARYHESITHAMRCECLLLASVGEAEGLHVAALGPRPDRVKDPIEPSLDPILG